MMRVLGGILIAIGVLIAGLSGLCTGAILYEDIGNPNADWTEGLGIVAIFGGIPFCVGLAIAIGGWFVIKQANKS